MEVELTLIRNSRARNSRAKIMWNIF